MKNRAINGSCRRSPSSVSARTPVRISIRGCRRKWNEPRLFAPMIRLTREQVRRIDRLAVERYHIPGAVLMENAAIAAANVAGEMIRPDSRTALILCGGGNNGGDGLAIARHLHNRGYNVRILLTTDPAKYAGEAKINWDICHAMNLPSANATAEAVLGSRAGLIEI